MIVDLKKDYSYLPKIVIKGKGYCPNPIAVNGIPAYADTISYPESYNTPSWKEFWDEQMDLIENGFTTGGIRINGFFYFWLNYYKISTVGRGYHLPDPIDTDYDLWNQVEEAKQMQEGLLIPKARRRGLSEVAGCNQRRGMLIRPSRYQAAIVAGVEKYANELFEKFAYSDGNMPPELQLHAKIDMQGLEYVAQWSEKNDISKQFKAAGSLNKVFARTLKNDPNILKGSFLDDCVFEESGENSILLKALSAAKKCFADGDKYPGTPWIYGTGGNVKEGSKDFKHLMYHAKENNLRVIRIYGPQKRKTYYIGSTNTNDQIEENCPNIEAIAKEYGYSREQIIGCEDYVAAINKIVTTQKELSRQPNKIPYFESLQDDPLVDEHVFLSFSGNDYSPELLSLQEVKILDSPIAECFRYTMDWERDEKGKIKLPLSVKLTPVPENEDPDAFIYIHRLPVKNVMDLYQGGIDSYDIDKSTSSLSLGSMVVKTRINNAGIPAGRIDALIRCRPARKEIFYDYCAMTAVLFNLVGRCMVDARMPRIIDYFIENGLERMLQPRPTQFDTERTEQYHVYGYKNTRGIAQNTCISLVQGWVIDCIHLCFMLPLIRDIREFDKTATDSDWDAHDALSLALLGDFSDPRPAIKEGQKGSGKDEFETGMHSFDDDNVTVVDISDMFEDDFQENVSELDIIEVSRREELGYDEE